jgi:hypothetical protein
MIVGNTASFAIESVITKAYLNVALRALGLFNIHIGGQRFGVYSPDASMLANSFDAVERRIANRGRHTAPFSTEPLATKIADTVSRVLYFTVEGNERFWGLPKDEFAQVIHSNGLLWAPDGDEAFDDGSYVLHFDVGDRSRLIGFKRGEGRVYDPTTLCDIWLSKDSFYEILSTWLNAFDDEWRAMPKTS